MLLLPYDRWYLKLGTMKLIHFVNPRIIDANSFIFPNNSLLYWFTVSDIPVLISRQYPYLKNMPKVYVKTIYEYVENETVGSFNNNNKVSIILAVDEIRKNEKTFKFISPNVRDLPVTDKTLVVVNYGILNTRYRYNSNMLNRYYKWYNAYYKLTSQLTQLNYKTERNRFVTIQLPPSLPRRDRLDKYAEKVLSGHLDEIPVYSYFNLIDIWRYLTPELKDTSLLSKIPDNELKDTTLLLILDNKVVALNLNILASIVEEYKLPTKLKQHRASTVRKLFYLFLNNIINNKAETLDVIINKEDNISDIDIDISKGIVDNYDKEVPAITKPIEKSINLDEELDNKVKVNTISDVVKTDQPTNLVEDTIDEDDEYVTASPDEIKKLNIDTYVTVSDIDTLLKEVPNPALKLATQAGKLADYGVISKNELNRINNTLIEQETLPSPFPNETISLKEMLDMSKDKIEISEESVSVTDNCTVKDKRINRNVVKNLEKQYIQERLKKDIARCVYHVQNAGILVDTYTVTEKENILGGTQEHAIRLKTLSGGTGVVKPILPIISEDGNMKLSMNVYRSRPMKTDLPIRKIDSTVVEISSNYGKYFIEKASYKKDDVGYWLRNKLLALYSKGEDVKDLVLIPVNNTDCKIPMLAALISRYVSSFKYKDMIFNFNYDTRNQLLVNKTITDVVKIENNNYILVGNVKGIGILMDYENNLYKYENNKYISIGTMYDILGINKSEVPIEYTVFNLLKKKIPTAILLCYYIGLNNLLRILNVKYYIKERDRTKIDLTDKYYVNFSNKVLVIDRDYGLGDMILGGLASLTNITPYIPINAFSNKDSFEVIFTSMELGTLYKNDIRLLEELFVDPITARLLLDMGEPITFKGLLIRANQMLVTDDYKHPNSINDMYLKGYERIGGMLYKELVTSIKDYENSSYYGKSKIAMNPYKILGNINEDSATVLVDDLNPLASLKQAEDTTVLGMLGRNKLAMSKSTRILHHSEIGIISEATKDSGDVGITGYMTATPSIKNTLGRVEPLKDGEDFAWTAVLSTGAMLAPFSTRDDTKRLKSWGASTEM